MATPFDGMSLVLSVGGIELLSAMSRRYRDSTWEIWDGFEIHEDHAFEIGARVNLVTGDYLFAIQTNLGHRGSNVSAVERITVLATMEWDDQTGSFGPLVLDDPGSDQETAESGQALVPLIWSWNATTKTVSDVFEGYSLSWQQTDLWVRRPRDAGVTSRFTFEADPDREDTSHGNALRCCTYGGSWLNTDGTRLRADKNFFHSADTGSWFHTGKLASPSDPVGWWLPVQYPTPSNNWPFYAGAEWSDAGNVWLCQMFVRGGVEIWTNPAWHFQIKQLAARLLNQHPHPETGKLPGVYPSNSYINYEVDQMRQAGRIPWVLAWCWRAMEKLKDWRTGDTESSDLAADLLDRATAIFNYQYRFSNPIDGLTGTYERRSGSGYGTHPESGYSLPANTPIQNLQTYQAGALWQGYYHLHTLMLEMGLSARPEVAKLRLMMEFIAVGYGGKEGVYQRTYLWNNSHPHPPPDPIPPAWASAPSWPAPTKHTKGWAIEYQRPDGNDHNDDLLYLSNVPGGADTTYNYCLAMYQWIKREGLATGSKIDDIIAQFATAPYQWHLRTGSTKVVVVTESIGIAETTSTHKTGSQPTKIVVVTESIGIAETTSTHKTGSVPAKIVVVTESIGIAETTSAAKSSYIMRLNINVLLMLGDGVLSGRINAPFLVENLDADYAGNMPSNTLVVQYDYTSQEAGAAYTSLVTAPRSHTKPLAELTVTAATNDTPIELTFVEDHGLTAGREVFVVGVGAGADGNFTVTPHATDPKKLTLNGSVGVASYTSGTARVRDTLVGCDVSLLRDLAQDTDWRTMGFAKYVQYAPINGASGPRWGKQHGELYAEFKAGVDALLAVIALNTSVTSVTVGGIVLSMGHHEASNGRSDTDTLKAEFLQHIADLRYDFGENVPITLERMPFDQGYSQPAAVGAVRTALSQIESEDEKVRIVSSEDLRRDALNQHWTGDSMIEWGLRASRTVLDLHHGRPTRDAGTATIVWVGHSQLVGAVDKSHVASGGHARFVDGSPDTVTFDHASSTVTTLNLASCNSFAGHTDNFGPELAACAILRDYWRGTNNFKCGARSAGVRDQTLGGGNFTKGDESHYEEMLAAWPMFLKATANIGRTVDTRAIVIVFGENSARTEYAASYKADMLTLMANLRADFGTRDGEDVPCILLRARKNHDAYDKTLHDQIRRATEEIVAEDDFAYMIDVDDLGTRTDFNDKIHWNGSSIMEAGERIAATVIRVLGLKKHGITL